MKDGNVHIKSNDKKCSEKVDRSSRVALVRVKHSGVSYSKILKLCPTTLVFVKRGSR